jgi:hypothetical protein
VLASYPVHHVDIVVFRTLEQSAGSVQAILTSSLE